MRHLRAADVDPHALVAALEQVGYRRVGYRSGVHVRLARPGETPPHGSLVIWLDRTAPEYIELMTAVLAALAGQAPPPGDEPDMLDRLIWLVSVNGNWNWITRKMGTDDREAMVAAAMRYDRWFQRTQHDGPPTPRSHFAWWES